MLSRMVMQRMSVVLPIRRDRSPPPFAFGDGKRNVVENLQGAKPLADADELDRTIGCIADAAGLSWGIPLILATFSAARSRSGLAATVSGEASADALFNLSLNQRPDAGQDQIVDGDAE